MDETAGHKNGVRTLAAMPREEKELWPRGLTFVVVGLLSLLFWSTVIVALLRAF